MRTVRDKALVLDANILIRAVLGPRVRNLIIENADRVRFFVPRACVADARKYLPTILLDRQIDPAPALELLEAVLRHVHELDDEWLADTEKSARERMRSRDEADWPVLAASMVLACPIWTQDADFFGVGVTTWSTEHVANFFGSPV